MTEQQLIDEGFTEGQKSFAYLWGLIEKNFNFQKVYEVMKLLDWHWHIYNENYGIPRVDLLRKKAMEMCLERYEAKGGSSSSGGFSAGFDDGYIWLSFSIEEWHSGDV